MSAWRRKALDSFPDRAREITGNDVFSTYALWGEVFLPLAREAYQDGDDDLLRRIFEYATWSARQPAQSVWNAVGVSFYEHLWNVARSADWMALVVRGTPDDVLDDVWVLWEDQMSKSELAQLRELRTKRPTR